MSTITLDHSHAQTREELSQRTQWRLYTALLAGGDIFAVSIAQGLAYLVRYKGGWEIIQDSIDESAMSPWLVTFVLVIWLAMFWAWQLYNRDYLLGGTQEYGHVFTASAAAIILIILATFFGPIVRLSRGWISLVWVLALLLAWITRFGLRRMVYALRRRGYFTTRALIVGTDGEARALAEQLKDTPTAGQEVIGFVSNHAAVDRQVVDVLEIIGTVESLPSLVRSHRIQQIIISTSELPRKDLLYIFETFGYSNDVELRFSSGLYELFTTGVHIKEVGAIPLVAMSKVRLTPMESFFKASFDCLLALVGLVGLMPILAVIALIIKVDSRGPVIYRRRVLGRGGCTFDAFKFRTMHLDGDQILEGHPDLLEELKKDFKLKNDPRLTRVGRWLRKLSLDEFPQLFNVLRGQMSLVGPRMITPEEAEKYGQLRMNLLTVKPGITGLWQIKGRSNLSYADRVRLDMYYIRNYSLWLDLQILLQTFPAVLRRTGAF